MLMSIILEYSFIVFLLLSLNYAMLKKGILLDVPLVNSHKNKKFFSKKVPKSLGLILLLFILYKTNFDISEKIFLSLFFFLGIQSDTNKLNSPNHRILLQVFMVIVFLLVSGEYINSTRIPLVDSLLQNFFFKMFLTLICMVIIINGSNFIDGLSTLCIGYYLGVFVVLYFITNNNYDISYLRVEIINICWMILILYFFNLLGTSFLGDSGSYLLGFLTSIVLIKIHNLLPDISPWLIAVLLWYPAFEVLFSIIRRFGVKYNPLFPDNRHLHQMIFLKFKDKILLKKNIMNPLVSNIINIYNFSLFYIAYNFYKNTKILICLFLFSCFIYIVFYVLLSKKLKNNHL